MRPTRLELTGFTAFRAPVVVDFADADLFALAGPTGAGKSSLIDAMCFALYGSVPRLDRRAVAPVISSSAAEARIRLDFTVGDDAYTAARVVRRTVTGATTKEARLEGRRHGEADVIAGDAESVTSAVTDLIGLGFEQFTTCVVLPQGEFARFLHDTPKGRQDLLVRLLDLGVYERMRTRAHERTTAAAARAEVRETRLTELAGATPDAVAVAEARVTELQRLHDRVSAALPELAALQQAEATARGESARLDEQRRRLQELRIPEGIDALDAAVDAAGAALAAAAAAVAGATADRERAELERDELGDPAELTALAAAHERRRGLQERVRKGRSVVDGRRRAADEAATALAESAATLDDANRVAADNRSRHAAAALRRDLAPGETCPVCGQVVDTVPGGDTPTPLREADDAVLAAQAQQHAAQQRHTSAVAALHGAEELLATVTTELAALDAELVDAPDPATVAEHLAAIRTADTAVTAARRREREAVEREREAGRRREHARAARDEAWTAVERARDRVADLAPPAPDRRSLRMAWAGLLTWQETVLEKVQTGFDEARDRAEAARSRHENLQDQLRRDVIAAGLAGDTSHLAATVHEALVLARRRGVELAEQVRLAESLRDEVRAEREREQVGRSLARHLAANGFERWLLDEALGRLAHDASHRLRALSNGQYSLGVDPQRNFTVVDHAAADERRPARTLSGGETFLASLSLALALADEIAGLAAGRAVRLESLFLDEGFGTLDPSALDVVASALDELGATGRTVGIVTHVRDLAERMPVRFEVRRTPTGATVERVER